MQFIKTSLPDALLIQVEKLSDNRGYFATTFTEPDFESLGLNPRILQTSTSFNYKTGTIRGMHFQLPPYAETKLVRCIAGAIYDVIIDLRPDSSTFGRWQSFELSAQNMHMLYIPEGFAHGYQTLTDDAEVFYQLGQIYSPAHARGIHYGDPTLGITWPLTPTIVSQRDNQLPYFKEVTFAHPVSP